MNLAFSENIENFMKALTIMGQGMIGIFVIMALIAISIVLIRKIGKSSAESEQND